ncbi:MAG TPA: hypothetical protein VEF35_10340 [Candidatus Bathyarchaeia archaeon]|nr:hypothetical protein [Candidatus Bathyarchaeia archaeon]
MQENCLEGFKEGQPWTPRPLAKDGHMVCTVSYDATVVTVLTWGNILKATWSSWDECGDDAYAILPPEAEKPDFALGFDFAQLQTDLTEVATDVQKNREISPFFYHNCLF